MRRSRLVLFLTVAAAALATAAPAHAGNPVVYGGWVDEGNSGTKTLSSNIRLPAGTTFDVWTADNTATVADGDYVAKTSTNVVMPASGTYVFEVTVNGDTKVEPDERFSIHVRNVSPEPGGDWFARDGFGTIYNDDVADTTAPAVSSVNRLDPNPTNAGTVRFTVTFTEAVTGVDASDFDVVSRGGLGGSPAITDISGTGNSRTVTLSSGSGSGTLELDVVDDDTIADGAGNPLGGTGAGNGVYTAGQTYTLDRSAPAVNAITQANPRVTDADQVQYSIQFSEAVTGLSAADFELERGGDVTGASITAVSAGTTDYTITVDTGTGEGWITLKLVDDDSIADAAGNPLGGAGSGNGSSTGPQYVIDRLDPSVVSSTRVDPSPTKASSVQFQVAFSEAVYGVGADDFVLTASGITGASVTGVLADAASKLYTVTVGTGTGSGTLRLDVPSDAGIVDVADSPLTGGFATGQSYTVDRDAPTVTSVVRTGPSPTNASSVGFTVTFAEPVTGVDAADFEATGLTGANVTNVTGTGATRTVTVGTGTGSGDLTLGVKDDDTIVDAVGNALDGAGSPTATYTVDRDAPAATLTRNGPALTDASSGTYTLTFGEAVTGVEVTDLSLVAESVSGASITSVTGSGTTYTIAVDLGSGDGAVRVDLVDDDSVVDAAGNPLGGTGTGNGSKTGAAFTVDRATPAVVSVTRVGSALTNADRVEFLVRFSEPVTGVGAGDFGLAADGIAGASILSVSGSGDTRTVEVGTGSGDGSLRLDVLDDDTIVDVNGKPLGGAGAGNGGSTAGQAYTLDRSAPALAIAPAAGQADPAKGAPIRFAVTASEAVAGLTASDVVVGGTAGATTATLTGSGTAYTVEVTGMTRDGTVTIAIPRGAAQDAAGNASAAATGDGSVAYERPVVEEKKAETPAQPQAQAPAPAPAVTPVRALACRRVPTLVRHTLAYAKRVLVRDGCAAPLVVDNPKDQADSRLVVTKQSPAAGTPRFAGEAVRVVVKRKAAKKRKRAPRPAKRKRG